jgi:Carbohydrate binding domain
VGTYVIKYNVTDAAGNKATEVTRTVNVTAFDDGLLTNGSFQAGAAPWLAGVGTTAAPVVTTSGNTYYSVNITSPDPGQPYLVNLSQKLSLTAGQSYKLTFDAWSDRSRTILAGIGRSGGDFANVNQSINLTTTRATYTATFTNIGFGEADNRVLFDNNGQAGLVNIDNVKLEVVTSGGGGGGSNLAANGDFETGTDSGWVRFQNGGTSVLDNTTPNNGTGSWSGKLATGGPSNPAFKQERIGAGTVKAGDVIRIKFDHKGAVVQPGAVFNVLLFGEGASGASFTHVFNPAPALGSGWATFTGTFTIAGGTDVSQGISFLIEAVCGGDAGCSVSANIDNVSVVLNP